MNKINRRSFIGKTSLGLAALGMLPKDLFAAASANNIDLGFQTFTVREMLGKDFAGTLKTMAGMGYKLTEMCYPKTYEKIGFAELAKLKTSDIKKTITDAGLSCPSCHFGSADFKEENLDATIKFSHELGITQVVCSTFWLPETATLNDYLVASDQLNKGAEKIKAAGLQAGFHNHEMEFHMLDGQLIYDAMMQRLDPNLVKMQFQTEVINLGYKASDYFKKYPGRFFSAHLSDWTADKKQAPIGKGVIDWKEFFAAAKTGGVKNYFVEMDFDTFKPSAEYIRSL